MFKPSAMLLADFYKISHKDQYPKGTTIIYSNLVARDSKRYKGIDKEKFVFFGLKYFIKNIIIDYFNEEFFKKDISQITNQYKNIISRCLGIDDVDTSHIEALHKLGYLPLIIKGMPEFKRYKYGTPVVTIRNTRHQFYWLVNFIETIMLSEMWLMSTNATISYDLKDRCLTYSQLTCDNDDHVKYQCHDFSFRGMSGYDTAIKSGMAHLTQFDGTDTIPAVEAYEYFYNEKKGASVPATEHSVMCVGGKDTEIETFKRMFELYPTGIVSIVSDTWDYWNTIDNILPQLKNDIMSRNGKLVVRPDSGNPTEVILQTIPKLWGIFGGTINNKGMKVLDSHIGVIYGDGITFEVIEDVFLGLTKLGFATSNIVFGIGAYMYQYNTRDSQSWAFKTTYCELGAKSYEVFKSPKDDSSKKSLRGLVMVEDGETFQSVTMDEEASGDLDIEYIDGTYKSNKF